jgi:hypothetical protein
MYTKFSERLSIKYPPYAEYPMPTVRSRDERPEQRNWALEAEITTNGDERCLLSAQPPIRGTIALGSPSHRPLFVYKLYTDSFKPIFPQVSISKRRHSFELESWAAHHD